MGNDTELIVVGKVGRTRGVHGELYITVLTDFPDRFLDMSEVHVRQSGQWTLRRIRSSRLVSGRPVVAFEGVENKEDAARMTNLELGVKRSELVPLPEGSYYVHDLVDCEVIDARSGKVLGTIHEVERLPANDVYVVRRKDSEEILVPAVSRFVKKVDISEKKIVVDAGELVSQKEAPNGK